MSHDVYNLHKANLKKKTGFRIQRCAFSITQITVIGISTLWSSHQIEEEKILPVWLIHFCRNEVYTFISFPNQRLMLATLQNASFWLHYRKAGVPLGKPTLFFQKYGRNIKRFRMCRNSHILINGWRKCYIYCWALELFGRIKVSFTVFRHNSHYL